MSMYSISLNPPQQQRPSSCRLVAAETTVYSEVQCGCMCECSLMRCTSWAIWMCPAALPSSTSDIESSLFDSWRCSVAEPSRPSNFVCSYGIFGTFVHFDLRFNAMHSSSCTTRQLARLWSMSGLLLSPLSCKFEQVIWAGQLAACCMMSFWRR